MADDRAKFTDNVRIVADEERQASARLIKRLKRLTPAAFLREPVSTFSRLTTRQYREIVATIAPEVSLPKEAVEDETLPAASLWERICAAWSEMTTLARALIIGTLISLIGVPLVVVSIPWLYWSLTPMMLTRPKDSTAWPSCRRLAWHVDGCLYRAPVDLYWEWIAVHAAQPVAELKANNPHLPASYVTAKSPVVIWRGRGRLSGSSR